MDRTKGTLLYASSLTVMSGATIAPSLPLIEETFHDVPHLSILVPLVLTTPSLFIAVGSWIAGLGVDRWGRKPFLTLGAAVYALAGTAGLWLADLHLLLLSRAVLGLAVAAVMTATTTLIGDLYRDEERTRFLGIQAAFMGLGGIVFLLAGGALADVSWRGPFLVYFASVGVVPLSLLALPRETGAPRARTSGTESEAVRRPGTIAVICGLALLGMLAFFMIPVRIPFLLEDLAEVSKLEVGGVIALGTVFAAVSSVMHRRLADRVPVRHLVTAMLALFAVGLGIVGAAGSVLVVIVGVAFAGLGTGLLLPTLNTWILAEAPPSRRGRLVGGLTSCFFLGQFVSPLATGPLIGPLGLDGAFGAVGAAMGVVAVASAIAGTRRR